MRVCEVIIFVCLFAKFFCADNFGSKTIERCYDCSNQPSSSCILKECDCKDSPRIRLKVDEENYVQHIAAADDAYETSEKISNQFKVQNLSKSNVQLRSRPAQKLLPPRMHCTESNFTVMVWNISKSTPPKSFYYVRYHEITMLGGITYETHLTRCNYMVLAHLLANTTYRAEVRSFSIGSGEENPTQRRSRQVNFRTRNMEDKPEEVATFYVDKWILQKDRKYTASVRWTKGQDNACFYNLAYFPSNGDYQEIDIDNPLVNDIYNITDLDLGSYYPIAITPYTLSTLTPPLEGPKRWLNVTTPSCLESYNEIQVCTPEQPQNLVVKEYLLNTRTLKHRYNVFMEWHRPLHIPEYYTAHLKLIDANNTEFFFNITGDKANVTFLNVSLSSEYEALLVAYSKRGASRPAIIHRQIVANYTFIEDDEPIVSVEFVLIIIIPIIIIGIFIMFLLNRFLTKKMKNHERNKYFKNFENKSSRPSTICTVSTITFGDTLKIDEWEIDTNKLIVKEVLGGGAFGVVHKGWYNVKDGEEIEVAIKMLRECPAHEEIKQFYQEIEIMKSVPLHPHLVSLIGCVTKQNLLLVVEYCSKGDLQSYLRAASDKILQATLLNQRSEYENCKYVFNKMYDINEVEFDDIPHPKDLISIARQVILGMEYLASLKLIHRDLAARNVLISENNIIKISDFGLSRDVYYDNIYYKSSGGKLPIRWMALESMTHQIYTTQSDVWSFGILLWEIVTLGSTPYPGVATQDVLGMLKEGYRMLKPDNCSEELYAIMCKCWNATALDRPSFTELKNDFDNLLATYSNYLDLDTNIIHKEDYVER